MRGLRRRRQDGARFYDRDTGEFRLRLRGHLKGDSAFGLTSGMKLRMVRTGGDVPVHCAAEVLKTRTVQVRERSC
jgi:hypothetical protein